MFNQSNFKGLKMTNFNGTMNCWCMWCNATGSAVSVGV